MKTLLQETLDLRIRHDEEPSHSDHVATLALQIFDSLRFALELDDRHRELLHAAALLHDIGWSPTPDGRGHHKESARLIREHHWDNLTGKEIPLVALIARYHRKSLPQARHEAFQALSPASRKLVMLLGGMLRLADALDRTHTGQIASARAFLAREAVTIRVKTKGRWEPERATFDLKRDLLQRALDRPVQCEEEK